MTPFQWRVILALIRTVMGGVEHMPREDREVLYRAIKGDGAPPTVRKSPHTQEPYT